MTEAPTQQHRRHPRFNHIAMTMPADMLDDAGRKEILDFCGEVFGWEELPQMTEDRKRLVIQAYQYGQFVFLHGDEKETLRAPRADHFGMQVATMDELDEMCSKAKAYAERDPRVEVIDKHVDDFGVLKLWSFYVTYLMPLMVEVQFFEYVPGGTYTGGGPTS